MRRYNRNVTRRDFMLAAAALGLAPNLVTAALPIAPVAKTAARSQDFAPEVRAAPALVFTDITRQAGLTMKIVDGGKTTVYLTDVNGEGAGFLDYNNDGYMDIYLVNGSLPKAEGGGQAPHDYLLRNNGDGTFTEVAEQAGLGREPGNRGRPQCDKECARRAIRYHQIDVTAFGSFDVEEYSCAR